jgi:hypothetical protein
MLLEAQITEAIGVTRGVECDQGVFLNISDI